MCGVEEGSIFSFRKEEVSIKNVLMTMNMTDALMNMTITDALMNMTITDALMNMTITDALMNMTITDALMNLNVQKDALMNLNVQKDALMNLNVQKEALMNLNVQKDALMNLNLLKEGLMNLNVEKDNKTEEESSFIRGHEFKTYCFEINCSLQNQNKYIDLHTEIKICNEKHLLWNFMKIILLGGNIEKNPGPRTKKTSLDKKRKQEKDRKREQRKRETVEEKSRRLKTMKENITMKRKNETPEEKVKRLETVKVKMSEIRENETVEAKCARLETEKRKMAEMRENETVEAKHARLKIVRGKMAEMRENETVEAKHARLKIVRGKMAKMRENETVEAKNARLKIVRGKMAEMRENETVEAKHARLKNVRGKMAEMRENETVEEKANRLKTVKAKMAEIRENMTVDEKAKRLGIVKEKMAQMRKNETLEVKSRRLEKVKGKMAEMRENETIQEKSRKLQIVKEKMAEIRKNETFEEKSQRLKNNRKRKIELKQSETTERKSMRLESMKKTMAKNREMETMENKSKRRECDKERKAKRRKVLKNVAPDMIKISDKFAAKVKTGPDFVCTCCHRMMYRDNVILYHESRYVKFSQEEVGKILDKFMYKSNIDSRVYMCITCDRSLKRGKIPPQAKVNNMSLDEVPCELSCMNNIESRLLSKRIPFMKMVALPRGKQTAIHGPAINVPTNLDTICTLLPRLPKDAEIIPLKLKRKLAYKSHYMYDSIRPELMLIALHWLKTNNKLYDDINVNSDWKAQWEENDPDLWQAISGIHLDETHSEDKCCKNHEGTALVDRENTEPINLAKKQCSRPNNAAVKANTMEHLELICQQEGFKIENVSGDGNCFFRSICLQISHIFHQKETHENIRHQLVTYLERNPKGPNGDLAYREFVANRLDELGDTEQNTDLDKYVENIEDDNDRNELKWQRYLQDLEKNAWADHIAVQGMADMLHVCIRIIATLNPATVIKPRDGIIEATLYLGLIGQSHYVSLKRQNTTLDDYVLASPIKINDIAEIDIQEQVMPDCSNESTSRKTLFKDLNVSSYLKKQEIKDELEHDYEVEFEQESQAFEESCKLRGLPLDTCLQMDTIDSNTVISMAPGEGQKPLNMLSDENFEEMAFPLLYPYGKGGFSNERCERITMRKFFNQRLLDVDGRFAKNIEYLLSAQFAVEYDQINNLSFIMMRQVSGRNYRGQKVTALDIKDPERLTELIQRDKAYKLLKEVRGTPAYWQKVHYDVLAQIRQLGLPTWFLTLSAAEMKWPEVIQIIARQYGTTFSDEDVMNMTWEEKSSWLKRNPVTAARHFQYRLDQFWKIVITSEAKPIGNVVDYMIRIEFQARGSPHAHTIIWVKDAPQYGKESDKEVTDFIDKYQICTKPTEDEELLELVQLQKHVHSKSCLRYGSCRFGIPKMPSPQTLISSEPETDNKTELVCAAKKVFSKVQKTLDGMETEGDVTLDEVLNISEISFDSYLEALKTSKNGHSVVLRRNPSEMNINSYNPNLLRIWKANMDIQYILDAYACVMYVTSYMMKSEKAMGELLKQVVKESRGDDIRTQLRKLGTTFLNNREVSSQESSYRILSLPLKRQSRKVVFINTDPKCERTSMTKPLSAIQTLEDDDEDLYLTSLIDRYAARPDSLENICLAEFAANYSANIRNERDNEGNEHTPNALEEKHDDERQHLIHLKNGLGIMHKRRREAIIRFHKYNIEKESEKYYRGKLMLYVPWRKEDDDILGDSETYIEQFRLKLNEVTIMEQRYSHNAQTLEEAQRDLDQFGPPEHAWVNVAPNAEHIRMEDELEGNVDETNVDRRDIEENTDILNGNANSNISLRYDIQADPNLLTNEEYFERMRNLNSEQKKIVNFHTKWCKSVVQCVKHNKKMPDAYHLYISGAGGVGKSHVISLLRHITIKYMRFLPDVQGDDVTCMLVAPTGTAAFNIDGMTIHSGFLFPVAMKQFRNLSAETLNVLRNKLQKLKVLIIDEISMVSATMLYHIHRRLEEIKGSLSTKSIFGDVTIIAVGDLYQLRPVKQSFVFDFPDDDYAKLHDPLWYQFKFAELTEIMRQKDDKLFAELLNRVRTDSCTEADIKLLETRVIKDTSEDYPYDSLHVYTMWKNVNKYNAEMMEKLNGPKYTIKSVDNKVDKNSGLKVEFSHRASDTGGLSSEIKIAVGCRVMLTYNIDVSDGLVNGATGTVVHISSVQNSVIAILVNFDNANVGKRAMQGSQYKQNYPNAVPISRIESRFNIGRRNAVSASRRQFPLILAWATTIHKVQGLTTDKIVVSFAGRFSGGQAYVALSRVKTLAGLNILDFDAKKIQVNSEVNEEMNRLRKHCSIACELDESDIQSELIISHVNIRGIKKHMKDLKVETIVKKSDVLCLCETFLKPKDKVDTRLFDRDDMVAFRVDRLVAENEQGHGGIFIASKISLQPILISRTITNNLEQVTIRITLQGQNISVTSVYRPPSSSTHNFIKEMAPLTDELQQVYNDSDFVIVGDFNEDLSSRKSSIEAFFDAQGFTQYTRKATRDSGSILDHSYVKTKKYTVSSSVTNAYYTDHDFVSMYFS